MDNLAHTLAGAALGQAGLKRRTGLGMATLMIAANLPDLDALALLVGESIAWRRGWTHGPVGLLVLPLLLVPIMIWFDRWQARRGTRPAARLPVRAGWLLGLAYIGILSHPLMDWLNVYGIRWLMPFSDRWFYGDTLFIIDVWLWIMLALGVWLSRRREKVKILWWDRHGFWLAYKRLERGRFPRPEVLASRAVSASELALWLEGIDLTRTRRLAHVNASRVS